MRKFLPKYANFRLTSGSHGHNILAQSEPAEQDQTRLDSPPPGLSDHAPWRNMRSDWSEFWKRPSDWLLFAQLTECAPGSGGFLDGFGSVPDLMLGACKSIFIWDYAPPPPLRAPPPLRPPPPPSGPPPPWGPPPWVASPRPPLIESSKHYNAVPPAAPYWIL